MTGRASIIILRNPLKPADRDTFETPAGGPFIDWLTQQFPNGFGRPIVVARNGQHVGLEDCDFRLAEGDVVTILVNPGALPAGVTLASMIISAVVSAAVTAAFTLALNAIFGKPSRPKAQDVPGPDPIYSISGAQNAARVGEPIPALYGRMITAPDYASQPYVFFNNNDQFLDQILCLGWGEFDIHDVRVGETPVSALEGNAVSYWQFGPADHGSTMGTIQALTGVQENIVTSPEVADQELNGTPTSATGDFLEFTDQATFQDGFNTIALENIDAPDATGWTNVQVVGTVHNNGVFALVSAVGNVITVASGIDNEAGLHPATFRYFSDPAALGVGPFITCAPGKTGDRISLDLVFPQGLFEIDEDTGALLYLTVDLVAEYQQVADDGTPVGGWAAFPISVSRNTNTPVRLTYDIPVPAGRYRVRLTRSTPAASNARQMSNLVWTGLKFRIVPVLTPVYGGVTLLVVRIRATNGIAGQASTRISADVTRKLAKLGTGPLVATTSPADAFVDIYTNQTYGARRPLAEVDVAELDRLEDHWAGSAHFNGGFAQRSTIWEALNMALQTAAASPLPLGQLMSAAQDGVKALRTQLFSDANIVRGTLTVGYNFDRPGDYDGVQIEFRDPATWNALFVTWPTGALDPDAVQLFGCTDQATALGFAKLLWNKRLLQRKTAKFETELEGLIPRLGDRVAVAAELPRWAMAGVVVRAAGVNLTLDADLDWSGAGHVVVLRNERGQPSDPIPVTPGLEANDLILAAPPPFPLFGTGSQEPTHFAFGSATSLVADFTVSNIEHLGGARVGIDAIVYNPDAFAGTLPWLVVPV